MFRVRPPSRRHPRTWPEVSCAGSLRLGVYPFNGDVMQTSPPRSARNGEARVDSASPPRSRLLASVRRMRAGKRHSQQQSEPLALKPRLHATSDRPAFSVAETARAPCRVAPLHGVAARCGTRLRGRAPGPARRHSAMASEARGDQCKATSLDAASGRTWTERDASSVTDVTHLCHRAQTAQKDCNSGRAGTVPVTNEKDRQLQRLDGNCAVLPDDLPSLHSAPRASNRRALDRHYACAFQRPRSARPLSEGHPIPSEPSRKDLSAHLPEGRRERLVCRKPSTCWIAAAPRHNCWNPPGTKC